MQSTNGVLVVETIIDTAARNRLERIFQKIVEAAPYGMIIVEARGRIVLVNPETETMFGYCRSELIGNSLEMLLPERFRAGHAAHREGFARAPSIRHAGVDRDLTARRKDGTEFPVEIRLNPVQGEEDELVLAVVNDVTRRNTMQFSLRRANANLQEFTYAASHDLKSPLRGIADLVEWIGEDLAGTAPPEVTRNLGRVKDRVQRLDGVIDDLLAYARACNAHTGDTTVDPRALISSVLEILPRPAGFRISEQIDAKPFVTNRAPLESVLRNLMDNAVKHHDRAAGHILVRVEDVGQYCVFSISDDGPGIPPAAQERMFRIFETLEPGNQRNSGIGLALSKRLVEARGGWLKLDSVAGVRGTAFHVWWPRC
ncbi:MAG: PAS domain-containing sensor histidine kinase [Gammaproteobacteria bacterium]